MGTTVKQRESRFTRETLMIHVFRVPLPLRAQHSHVTKQRDTQVLEDTRPVPRPEERASSFSLGGTCTTHEAELT